MEHSLGSDHVENAGDASSTRLILLSPVISTSVVWIPSLLAGNLLIDIGETFGQPVGVVGQLFTVTRIVGLARLLHTYRRVQPQLLSPSNRTLQPEPDDPRR